MPTPVTTEEALERLAVALRAGDMKGVDTWTMTICGNNDMRVRAKQRMREANEAYLRRESRRSLRLP